MPVAPFSPSPAPAPQLPSPLPGPPRAPTRVTPWSHAGATVPLRCPDVSAPLWLQLFPLVHRGRPSSRRATAYPRRARPPPLPLHLAAVALPPSRACPRSCRQPPHAHVRANLHGSVSSTTGATAELRLVRAPPCAASSRGRATITLGRTVTCRCHRATISSSSMTATPHHRVCPRLIHPHRLPCCATLGCAMATHRCPPQSSSQQARVRPSSVAAPRATLR